ncbi:hypothetical protein T439DRAFT_332044 [Meredithblackwellia eburnea MCA 4105]
MTRELKENVIPTLGHIIRSGRADHNDKRQDQKVSERNEGKTRHCKRVLLNTELQKIQDDERVENCGLKLRKITGCLLLLWLLRPLIQVELMEVLIVQETTPPSESFTSFNLSKPMIETPPSLYAPFHPDLMTGMQGCQAVRYESRTLGRAISKPPQPDSRRAHCNLAGYLAPEKKSSNNEAKLGELIKLVDLLSAHEYGGLRHARDTLNHFLKSRAVSSNNTLSGPVASGALLDPFDPENTRSSNEYSGRSISNGYPNIFENPISNFPQCEPAGEFTVTTSESSDPRYTPKARSLALVRQQTIRHGYDNKALLDLVHSFRTRTSFDPEAVPQSALRSVPFIGPRRQRQHHESAEAYHNQVQTNKAEALPLIKFFVQIKVSERRCEKLLQICQVFNQALKRDGFSREAANKLGGLSKIEEQFHNSPFVLELYRPIRPIPPQVAGSAYTVDRAKVKRQSRDARDKLAVMNAIAEESRNQYLSYCSENFVPQQAKQMADEMVTKVIEVEPKLVDLREHNLTYYYLLPLINTEIIKEVTPV